MWCVEGSFDGGGILGWCNVWTERARLGGRHAPEADRGRDRWECFVEEGTDGGVNESGICRGGVRREAVRGRRVDKFVGCKEVRLRDVANVGIVKQVVVVPDLEVSLAAFVDLV